MTTEVRGALWLVAALAFVVGSALYAWSLGIAAAGAVLMWRLR